MNDEQDRDRDRDGETRREGQAVAPAPNGAALASTSLTALDAALSNVIRLATVGRSNKPIVSFRSREEGIWTIGQRRTLLDEGQGGAQPPLVGARVHLLCRRQ
jgi:hypothetical protein